MFVDKKVPEDAAAMERPLDGRMACHDFNERTVGVLIRFFKNFREVPHRLMVMYAYKKINAAHIPSLFAAVVVQYIHDVNTFIVGQYAPFEFYSFATDLFEGRDITFVD